MFESTALQDTLHRQLLEQVSATVAAGGALLSATNLRERAVAIGAFFRAVERATRLRHAALALEEIEYEHEAAGDPVQDASGLAELIELPRLTTDSSSSN